MKRIEKIIKQVESGELSGEELITELNVLKSLIENVENHLNALKESAKENWKKESDEGSLSCSVAYETSLELFTTNMEEGEII